MSTSFIGKVSIIEVYVNVCGLYFMLEELKKKSRQKYHNVVVWEEVGQSMITCQHLAFKQSSFDTRCTLAILIL
jgi:hypothetical protein